MLGELKRGDGARCTARPLTAGKSRLRGKQEERKKSGAITKARKKKGERYFRDVDIGDVGRF